MKMFPCLFVSIVMIMIVAGLQIVSVKADAPNPNLEVQKYVKNELLQKGLMDFTDPAFIEKFPNPQDRVISGDFVAQLFTDSDLQTRPLFKIFHATVVGDINAAGVTIPYNIEFYNCTFKGRINLDSASVKTFTIEDSSIAGSVRMGRLVVQGDLSLYQSTFEAEVTLFDANISNNLFAAGSHFLGTKPDSDSTYPFELWKIHVGQTTEFTNADIKGEVKADDADFGVDVKFDGVTFEKPASFMNVHVGNLADFQNVSFKDTATFESSILDQNVKFGGATFEKPASFMNVHIGNQADFQKVHFKDMVNFESSIWDRDIELTSAVFDGDANFDYVAVTRFFDFDQAVINKGFSFQYSTIGWPNFAGTQFNGPVNFTGLQASNDFDLTDASYNYSKEPFAVGLAKVTGRALFNGFVSPRGLDLSNSQFAEVEIEGKENDRLKFAEINLVSTAVGGDLILDNLEAQNISAEGLDVQGKTTFTRLVVNDKLNMSNAHLGFFTMSAAGFWPVFAHKNTDFNLRGMVYNDIGLVDVTYFTKPNADQPIKDFVDKELEDNTWGVLSNMVAQSEYSPQAYHTLEQFLIDKGHPDWAAQVEVDRKIRERDEILKGHSIGAWLWSWFMYLFSGYGQIPALALVWSALVVVIGAILYWRESDLVILDQSEAKPVYNPFFYSFAVFVPFIELDIAEKWDPHPYRRVAWIYKYVLKILGWILTPIALLTFGGIIK